MYVEQKQKRTATTTAVDAATTTSTSTPTSTPTPTPTSIYTSTSISTSSESTRNCAPDAGNRNLDHYKYRLPKYRYVLRQNMLPLIRWETSYLAYVQDNVRTPALDSYFAITANLGTHTFFMVMLPIMFWFGYTTVGRAIVHILASGVFFSGFVKDMLCLPRPLSPPLHRITMSGSAALEYGFPSTHSTNAVSVAFYALAELRSNKAMEPNVRVCLELLAWLYAASIVLGRIYCGMHGFMDVIVGSAMGALLAWIQWTYQQNIDAFVYSGDWTVPVVITLSILILIRMHPEPADPCPCFDDGVAFSGVVIGVNLGHWHYAHSNYSWSSPALATVPYMYQELGFIKTFIRVLLGVVIIFAWREIVKPTLHTILPPLYRFIEGIGLSLPRKDYKPASEYTKVPNFHDDTLPPLQEIPTLIQKIRRTRTDSVGPQSAADAYETLAYRQKIRRESIGEASGRALLKSAQYSNAVDAELGRNEQEMGNAPEDRLNDLQEEAEVLMQIERPRGRYDVEVVTKLIVYSGIAWLAVEVIPILFEFVGLGMGVVTAL